MVVVLVSASFLMMAVPAQGDETNDTLRAGAATSNITPSLGMSINGGMRDRKAGHIHDELHARAVVLDNGQTQVAIVTCDSCVVPESVFAEAKESAHVRTKIPVANMLMAATHTHSAPTAAPVFQSTPDADYQAFLSMRIADAVCRASNQLVPAQVGWGVGHEPEHVFNRRWHMKEGAIGPNPFGQDIDRVKMNPPRASKDLIEPAGPVDPEIPVMAVRSTDGRPVAVMANYALHYVGGGHGNHISADYFGMFADRIQQLLDADRLDPPFVGMLTNGASGNINNINFRVETPRRQPYEQMRIVANDVAAHVHDVVTAMSYKDQVVLATRQKRIRVGVRRPDDEEVRRAGQIVAGMKTDEAQSLEQIYALETIAMSRYPATVEVPLQVLRIGEAGIAAIPCEVFVEIGLELKEKSPLTPTIIIELANGYHGYLPTPAQHELGGYETWRARSSYLEKDASPRIVSELLAMLNDLRQIDSR
jgi:hypothetical protein